MSNHVKWMPGSRIHHRAVRLDGGAGFFVIFFSEKLLTNERNSCNIIQVAARYRPARNVRQGSLSGNTYRSCRTASFQTKKKNKKVLDSLKEMRYNK